MPRKKKTDAGVIAEAITGEIEVKEGEKSTSTFNSVHKTELNPVGIGTDVISSNAIEFSPLNESLFLERKSDTKEVIEKPKRGRKKKAENEVSEESDKSADPSTAAGGPPSLPSKKVRTAEKEVTEDKKTYVYIGTSIRRLGLISGAAYRNGLPETVKKVLEREPLARFLFVEPKRVAEGLKAVRRTGSKEYKANKRLQKLS